MDGSLRAEINACIQELESISKALDNVAADIQTSMIGMNTLAYIIKLETIASSYRAAARKLKRIK